MYIQQISQAVEYFMVFLQKFILMIAKIEDINKIVQHSAAFEPKRREIERKLAIRPQDLEFIRKVNQYIALEKKYGKLINFKTLKKIYLNLIIKYDDIEKLIGNESQDDMKSKQRANDDKTEEEKFKVKDGEIIGKLELEDTMKDKSEAALEDNGTY